MIRKQTNMKHYILQHVLTYYRNKQTINDSKLIPAKLWQPKLIYMYMYCTIF